MSDNGRDRITFRLRNVDEDLREAIKGIDASRLSELTRDGLRLILGIKTTKRVEITERPINVLERHYERQTAEETVIRSKPFVPKGR